jgi:hypothetical protein
MLFRLAHWLRTLPESIRSTLFGIFILAKSLHLSKHEDCMVVTPSGNSMFFSPRQPLKAYLPMVVTPFGIMLFLLPTTSVLVLFSIKQLPRLM